MGAVLGVPELTRPAGCKPGKPFPGGKEATVISIIRSRISGSNLFLVYAPPAGLATLNLDGFPSQIPG
jgi:hypothetical protein